MRNHRLAFYYFGHVYQDEFFIERYVSRYHLLFKGNKMLKENAFSVPTQDPHVQRLQAGVLSNEDSKTISELYSKYSRPGLSKLLKTLRMQQCYTRAQSNSLFYNNDGKEIEVLDALGGFGACIFGHNHEPLVNKYQDMLLKQVPFLAQASTRVNTALLGDSLNRLLYSRFNDNFISITLNTGADAVEAAIKHSELVRKKKLNKLISSVRQDMSLIRKKLRHQTIVIPESTIRDITKSIQPIETIEDALTEIESYLKRIELTRPATLSVKRAYHGKSTGALQLTHGEAYRKPFTSLGLDSHFVNPDSDNPFEHVIENYLLEVPSLKHDGGILEIEFTKFLNVNALFAEPLQGEGGIRPLSKAFLSECRDTADGYGFPLVFDEIQSGMGRTGTFLYCEQLGVKPDVVLLSKSLGGGMAKISVSAFSENIYDPDFDEIHSSTFAEDELSAGVALEALNLISEPELMAQAKHKGDYLKSQLSLVCKQYPEVAKEVRGEGLFLGFVFEEQQHSESFVIRFLSENGLLGYVVAGYLLHEHDIRIGSTLSDSHVLRIEPSLYITDEQCDRLIKGIGEAAEVLAKANAYQLTKYMIALEKNNAPIADFRGKNCGRLPSYEPGLPTVTFVATPASAVHVMDSDESLKLYTPRQVVDLLAQIVEVLGPVETETRTIQSITGKKINFRMLILMYDPVFISKRLASGYLSDILENIRDVQQDCESLHHTVLGLGSYTSIVSHNGMDLISDDISITTGNALTVGMGARAILKSSDEHAIDLAQSTMAVLGAGGNIGSVYSEVLADHVPRLLLIGRENRLARLYQTALSIYKQAHESIVNKQVKTNSIAEFLQDHSIYLDWVSLSDDSLESFEVLMNRLNQALGNEAPVHVTDDMTLLSSANLILTCSNAPAPIVFPNMIGKQKTIICDVSVPQDVDDSVGHECENVELIRGGLVKLPLNPEILWMGNQCLGSGVSYACMAETMLLGLEGRKEHGSYGKISKQEVNSILDIADLHGFELAKIKVEKVF